MMRTAFLSIAVETSCRSLLFFKDAPPFTEDDLYDENSLPACITIDTSAIVAILQLEPEAASFTRCIEEAGAACASAVSLQEASMVLAGRGGDTDAWASLDRMIRDLELKSSRMTLILR